MEVDAPASPVLVIVTGPPASGKSTIARDLAAELNLPFFQKDAFKELLADSLQVTGLTWSRSLGSASFEILYLVAEHMLSAGQSLLIEGNFSGEESSKRLRRIARDSAARVVQVSIHAKGDLLLQRYEAREEKGERHPIHVDRPRSQTEAFRSGLLQGKLPALDLDGNLIRVDTSNFDEIDVPELASRIRRCLAHSDTMSTKRKEG